MNRERFFSHDEQIYSVLVTGGIGDSIIVARALRDLQKVLRPAFQFDIYYRNPWIIEPFFKNIAGFRRAHEDTMFKFTHSYYQFSFVANQLIYFVDSKTSHNFAHSGKSNLNTFVDAVKRFKEREELKDIMKFHPFLDGALSDQQSHKGRTRFNFLHEMLGVSYGGHSLDLERNEHHITRFGLVRNEYITIHDGWDLNFHSDQARPTKALPITSWNTLVAKLKKTFPTLKIVQLGGSIGEDIQGVDVNLRNRIDLKTATSLLAFSALHVDTESGLVHIASALGTKSFVFFGPTNLEWFGYPENCNVRSNQCGNCWWSTDTWMKHCPLGSREPRCMNTFNLERAHLLMCESIVDSGASNPFVLTSAATLLIQRESPEVDSFRRISSEF